MALQPLDLQTLFTQLDKVGKLQTAQKEGLAIQQSLQGIQAQKKTEEQMHSVDTAQQGEDAEHINDRNSRKRSGEQPPDPEESGENQEPAAKPQGFFVVHDPSLGKNIDMRG